MAIIDQQKGFLEAIADDTQPVVYCHAELSHSVFLTRVTELSPYKFEGRLEPVYQLTMVEALAAASGVSLEEQFLLNCANDIEPVVYKDRLGEQHHTIITRLAKTQPYKFKGRVEPVWQLTLVDAWGGYDLVQDAEAATIQVATATSVYDHVVMLWQPAETPADWDFCQWE